MFSGFSQFLKNSHVVKIKVNVEQNTNIILDKKKLHAFIGLYYIKCKVLLIMT